MTTPAQTVDESGSGIDLHTHSSRSDGTDTPAELVGLAKAAGLTVVALTDHDTTVGWAEATAAATAHGIELVRGLEFSVEDAGQGLHLLAYEPNSDDRDLRNMLARSIEARDSRIPLMVEKIAVVVPDLRLEDVLEIAGTAVLGRPHLAQALVRIGAAADLPSAFRGLPGVRLSDLPRDLVAAARRGHSHPAGRGRRHRARALPMAGLARDPGTVPRAEGGRSPGDRGGPRGARPGRATSAAADRHGPRPPRHGFVGLPRDTQAEPAGLRDDRARAVRAPPRAPGRRPSRCLSADPQSTMP